MSAVVNNRDLANLDKVRRVHASIDRRAYARGFVFGALALAAVWASSILGGLQ